MTRVTVTLAGTGAVRQKLLRRAAKANQALATELAASADVVRQTAQAHLDDHTRAPVSRSGRLRNSLAVVRSPDGLIANIGTLLSYGAHLEFGTRNMPSYPWLAPALWLHTTAIKTRLRSAVARAMGARRG